MDTREWSLSPDAAAELQLLRRRAYGPDADIAGDPVAQARLAQLETATGGSTAPGRTATEALLGCERHAPGAVEIPLDGPAEPVAAVGAPRTTRRARRRATTALIAGALLLAGAGIAATIPAAMGGRAAATLHVRAQNAEIPAADRAELRSDDLSHLGLIDDQLRLYDDFRGVNVWSAPTVLGTTCLILTTRSQGLWALGCAPPETDPQIELNKFSAELLHRDEQDPWHGMPFGSLIRVTLRDDTVLVWDYPAPGPPSLFD